MKVKHYVFVFALAVAPSLSPAADKRPSVLPGVDVLVEQAFAPLAGMRVGLITNPTGVTSNLRSTVDVLHEAKQVELVALFGPEHGVRGDVPAGGHVADTKDKRTGVPVYSLYGKNRRPSAQMLEGIDVLVFDIQDIGSRSYTFISTMAAAMESAAEHNIRFVVLDRPNPMTGNRIEGKPLDLKYKSFVGYLPIPYVHGMTVGELAQMINDQGWLPDGKRCDLTVVPMKGWKRDMLFSETGLHWVLTSPHIPRAESSLFYAATGIMGELQVISEGVGYTLPFELAGAPDIDAEHMADELNGRQLAGIHFRPIYFQPYYTSLAKKVCGGVQIVLLDPHRAHLTSIQFHIMDYVRKHHSDKPLFGGKRDALFDTVCGMDTVRTMFIEQKPVADIITKWNEGVTSFRTLRKKYLLYN